MTDVLIFAGTTEGRRLAEAIVAQRTSDRRFFVSVATEYGQTLLPEAAQGFTPIAGRMTKEEMERLIQEEQIGAVIDATHPYATEVSANIKQACAKTGADYVRLKRDSSPMEQDCIVVGSCGEAAAYLNKTSGKALLTIGSKELEAFAEVKDRVYPRILPSPEMVQKACDMGFHAANLICMQGPFSYDMNLAMLRQIGAQFLVTKESGSAGGFEEKVAAAKSAGAKVIVIGRPREEEKGVTLEEAMALCGVEPNTHEEKHRWFPLFTDIKDKKIVLVGGGKIARRRIKGLLDFSCSLTVVAPDVSDWVLEQVREGRLGLCQRGYEPQDIEGADFVLAATDDRELNRRIGVQCREAGVPVNVADCKEDCDFYFPGLIQHGELTVGLTAGGKDHALVARARRAIEKALKEGMS